MATAVAANTIATIIPYLKPLAEAVTAQSRASPEQIATVHMALDGVRDAAAALAASETAAASAPLIDRIAGDAQAILGVAAKLPLPGPLGIILQISSMLVPTAIAAVKMLVDERVTVEDRVPYVGPRT